jgi:hypothetical protein
MNAANIITARVIHANATGTLLWDVSLEVFKDSPFGLPNVSDDRFVVLRAILRLRPSDKSGPSALLADFLFGLPTF